MNERRLDGKPLLLIVDDDPDARALLTTASEREEMASISAQNGDAALVMAASIVPDLILMDAIMPGKSGFDACRAIKAQAHLAHIP
ncbi:MAG: response regulator, partial [Caulobacterales bacterium]